MKHFLAGFALTMAFSSTAYAADLKIELNNIRNDKGSIAIVIYDNAASFKENKTDDAPYVVLLNAAGSKTLTLHDFPKGTYAISILHDEDKNHALNVNKRGFPTEGYAYSNNVGKISVPSFKKASFIHLDNANTVQVIEMIYIK